MSIVLRFNGAAGVGTIPSWWLLFAIAALSCSLALQLRLVCGIAGGQYVVVTAITK